MLMATRMRHFILIAGLCAAAFVLAPPALAQGWRETPWWADDPRALRERPAVPRYEDPYFQPPAAGRWRYEEGRGWTRRPSRSEAWDEFEEGPDRREQTRRPAPGYYADDAWDEEPGYGNGQQQVPRNAVGVNGGSRPYITPRSPPVVAFAAGTKYKAGEIVIDTSARRLYYVRNSMSAFAYPIGVGRDGFSWAGQQKVSRIADWPDWYPPAEMRKRKPELPERMLGGLNNPLGAKAIYLGSTLYRIHGTNDPKSIGRAESSGCFRMMNEHVLHLASLVRVGTLVTVQRSLRQGTPAPRTVTAKPPKRAADPRVRWSTDPDGAHTDTGDYSYR
jgi:lipoprotein-anchoring transpeptidase ErfK/SrfK